MDPDGPYSDSPVDVFHMPKPEPLPLDAEGNPINLRIPKFVREFKLPKSKVVDEINSMEHLSAQETLALSLPHWKNVKKEFLNASRENEKRYHHSFCILKSMFEKYDFYFVIIGHNVFCFVFLLTGPITVITMQHFTKIHPTNRIPRWQSKTQLPQRPPR